jgi:hypothetical protein
MLGVASIRNLQSYIPNDHGSLKADPPDGRGANHESDAWPSSKDSTTPGMVPNTPGSYGQAGTHVATAWAGHWIADALLDRQVRMFCHRSPMTFPDGANTLYQAASSTAAVLTGNPFHSEGSGVATNTFTRLAAAGALAIRSSMRALVR